MLRALAQTLISWGPAGVFLLALLDSAGVPLPATVDALVVALAAANPPAAYLAGALAAAGSTAGCLVLFHLARKGGQLYLDKRAQSRRTRRFREWFRQYGLVTVFIPALLPVPLPTKVFILSAGALGVGAWPFLLVILAARIPRYFGLAYLGAQLGEHSMGWLRDHSRGLALAALALTVLLFLLLKLAGRLHRSAARLG